MWTNADAALIGDLLVAPQRELPGLAEQLRDVASRIDEQRAALTERVRETSIAVVPGLFADWLCAEIDATLVAAPWVVGERVETAEGSWTIDLVDNSYVPLAESAVRDPFTAICLAPAFIETIGSIAGYDGQEVITTRRWVNRYGPGDGIAPHVDTTGDFQIMVCLDAPEARHGGRLVLANGAEVDLQRGDLLVMAHTEVLHWTLPLAADTPRHRATATCRYYVAGGRLPRSKVLPHTQTGPRTRPDTA